ncbi:hypothetical protein CL630_02800 [bacterium]|nr:hypothetical protein [bacterium]|tara:strand:- start:4557 stop:5183 length:627 start_codon:yes stop_codon:yes gene_type:complete
MIPPINKQQRREQLPQENTPDVSHMNKTQKQFHYRIVMLVVVNIFMIAVYAFLFGFILQKKDSIVASVSKLDTEQLREQQLKILKDGFRTTELKREALDAYFIDSQEIVSFIEEIEQAGRHTNVFLEFNFVNIRDTESGGTLVMEFETIGSFHEIFYFLQLVENLPARTSLSTFVLSRDIPKGTVVRKKSDVWRAVFTVNVLSFENTF